MITTPRLITALPLMLILATPLQAADGPLQVQRLTGAAPTVDGVADAAWAAIPATRIALAPIPQALIDINKSQQQGKYASNWAKDKYTTIDQVELKAAHDGTHIYFLARWPDATKDDRHKPHVWSGSKTEGEYASGKEREDRLAMMFPISGSFSYNKLAGSESVVDMWQWKANRTNAAGVLHDKHHIYTNTKPTGKSAQHYTADGTPTFISRISDPGGAPYTSQKIDPFTYQGDIVRNYIPATNTGDAADVKATGVWADGYWTVEIQRKLDTGNHQTDTTFTPGSTAPFAISVFDHVGDHFHAISTDINMVIAE